MRVAIVSWTSRYAGGVESYVGAVMRAMCDAGLDVAFFHEADEPKGRARIDVAASVPVFNVASVGVERALDELAAWKPDLIYSQGVHDVQTGERLIDIAPSVTFVHTYTGTCISGTKTQMRPAPSACSRKFGPACLALYFPRQCGGNNPLTMLQLYGVQKQQYTVLRKQTAVITHSEHMRNELAMHGIAATVISFPISMPDADVAGPVAASNDILFAGRMDTVKGGILLLNALPQVRQTLNQPLRVQFSGDGPDRPRWETHARRIQADDSQISIQFAGWATEPQLSAQMQRSRLLVVPSVWPEPYGSVGMAAARYGVPAAAFAVGGIPQWLHDGVNGHLASATPPTAAGLAEAILQCLRDPEHYTELSSGARQLAARASLQRHIPELISVFDRVLHGRA
jgi:glycosyltransferase involved in cell wall biosynthesis